MGKVAAGCNHRLQLSCEGRVIFTCRRTLEFQIDPRTGPAYVNFPDARQIAVADLDALRVLARCPMGISAPISRWRLI